MSYDEAERRRTVIWSVNAWVGMSEELSDAGRNQIFKLALADRLPDATDTEVAYALGIISALRDHKVSVR